MTETVFFPDPECISDISVEDLQWITAQNGETFYAPTRTITAVPTLFFVEYPNLTPDQPSLGTEFGLVSSPGEIVLI